MSNTNPFSKSMFSNCKNYWPCFPRKYNSIIIHISARLFKFIILRYQIKSANQKLDQLKSWNGLTPKQQTLHQLKIHVFFIRLQLLPLYLSFWWFNSDWNKKNVLIQLILVDKYFNRNDLAKIVHDCNEKQDETITLLQNFQKISLSLHVLTFKPRTERDGSYIIELPPQCLEHFNQHLLVMRGEGAESSSLSTDFLRIWQRLSFHQLIKYARRDLNLNFCFFLCINLW